MQKYYFFDFDGTLTTRDTMFLFLKFYNKKKFYLQFAKFTPLFILLKLKLADAENIKKAFIAAVLKNSPQKKLELAANDFFDEFHEKIMRKNAIDFLKNRAKDSKSFLVTASLDIWAKPFSQHYNMELIATEAKFLNGFYSGEFATKNCNGKEKVNRILLRIKDLAPAKTIAFGDTSGDAQMLAWANEGHFKFFH